MIKGQSEKYIIVANFFISSIDNDEEHWMHSKSDNIEIITNDESDEVIKEHFDSLKKYIKIIYNQ